MIIFRFEKSEISDDQVLLTLSMKDASGEFISKNMNIPQRKGSLSHPTILPIIPLPELSKFPIEVTASVETTVDGTVLLSPIELVVDKPINLGCFQMNLGEHASEQMSPQTCLMHCNNFKKRLALITEGNKCSCLAKIDHDKFSALSSSQCSIHCQEDQENFCGGKSSASLYIAGGHISCWSDPGKRLPNKLTQYSSEHKIKVLKMIF